MGDALGQGEQGRRGPEQPLGSVRVAQVARLATPSGEGAEADLVGGVVTLGAQRLVADAGAAQERQRIETALDAERGQEALLQKPGDVLGGGAAGGESGPEESHASGGGRRERDGRTTGHGDAGLLERPLELRGVLDCHDGERAAIERGSSVERPTESVDQRCRLAPRARSDDGLERIGGKAPRWSCRQPAHGLREGALGELGEQLDAGEIRPGLERLEERLERGIDAGIPGQRDPQGERTAGGRGGAGERGEEPHHGGGKRRSDGQLELLEREVRRPPVGEHAARGNPSGGGQLDSGPGHPRGGVVDPPGEVGEPGPGRAELLGCLGQGRRRDAAERELVEEGLEGALKARGPGLCAERAGSDRVDGRGEETVEGGAAARPEPRWRDDCVAQLLEGPALLDFRALHGGPVTLRPAHDTAGHVERPVPGRAGGVVEALRTARRRSNPPSLDRPIGAWPSKVPDTFGRPPIRPSSRTRPGEPSSMPRPRSIVPLGARGPNPALRCGTEGATEGARHLSVDTFDRSLERTGPTSARIQQLISGRGLRSRGRALPELCRTARCGPGDGVRRGAAPRLGDQRTATAGTGPGERPRRPHSNRRIAVPKERDEDFLGSRTEHVHGAFHSRGAENQRRGHVRRKLANQGTRRGAPPHPGQPAPGLARWATPSIRATASSTGAASGGSDSDSATVTARYAPSRPSTRARSSGFDRRAPGAPADDEGDHEADRGPTSRLPAASPAAEPHGLALLGEIPRDRSVSCQNMR